MPGILPMKVIKIGSSAQARIAQACDRCRSKKIRCDGLRPTCTQCSQVGFECKTSDKLSRRAFPRGYTESLEERVRALENEIRELKDLLDSKDEKIDLLSKVHSQSPPRAPSDHSPYSPTAPPQASSTDSCQDLADTLCTHHPFFFDDGNDRDFCFTGSSSGRALAGLCPGNLLKLLLICKDSLKRKAHDANRPDLDLDIDSILPLNTPGSPTEDQAVSEHISKAPPRLFSDQMVNLYFQEWAPLFPVLNRQEFLVLYEKYMSDPESIQDGHSLALLNLVLGIAALSSPSQVTVEIDACERRWRSAFEAVLMSSTLETLQCLVLAQLFYIQRGNCRCLQQYKGIAVGLAHRLGLHRCQTPTNLDASAFETRKRVVWTLYTIDCFSAASAGLPTLMKDRDMSCEYPVDIDDEYIQGSGFQPSTPGEHSKTSSAIAFFKVARILSRCLDRNFLFQPKEISVDALTSLSAELDSWSQQLPEHLKLTFIQDKPSTRVIGDRCPLLSLAFHYTRTLIHRPALYADASDKTSASIVAVASSSKHMIQILQLIDERNLGNAFCLNRNELLTVASLGVLFQTLDLKRDSRLLQDSQKVIYNAAEMLDAARCPASSELKRLSHSLTASLPRIEQLQHEILHRPRGSSPSKTSLQSPDFARKELQNIAHRYTLAASQSLSFQPMQNPNCHQRRPSLASSASSTIANSEPGKQFRPIAPSTVHRSIQRSRPSSISNSAMLSPKSVPRAVTQRPGSTSDSRSRLNLDYFSFSEGLEPSPQQTLSLSQRNSAPALRNEDSPDWNQLLAAVNDGDWAAVDSTVYHPSKESSVEEFKTPFQDYSSREIWELPREIVEPTGQSKSQSLFSHSEDSLTSGEEFSSIDMGSAGSDSAFKAMLIPGLTPEDSGASGLEGDLGSGTE